MGTTIERHQERSARWRRAIRIAAASFFPNYRRIREEERGRRLISFTRFVARLYVIGSVATTVGTLIQTFTARTVFMTIPVQPFWPKLPPGAHITGGPTATIVDGTFSTAVVSVSGLDGAARAWLGANSLLQGITVTVIAIVVSTLCTTVLEGNPFRPVVARGIRIMGITVITGGLGWQVCSSVAGRLASLQAFQLGSAEFPSTTEVTDLSTIIGFPQPGYGFQVDFWPIWLGLAMLALSAVFRYGTELSRDAEGLV